MIRSRAEAVSGQPDASGGRTIRVVMLARTKPAAGARFAAVYRGLVGGLGSVCLGGWLALLLSARGDGAAALVVLVGSAVVAGGWAGPRGAAIVAVEAAALVALALQMPLLGYLWADAGPLALVAVLVVQAPVAMAAARLARR